MTRGIPTYNTGSLGVVGSGQVASLFSVITTEIATYTTFGGADAWTIHDFISGTDIVYHSSGDRGLGATPGAFKSGDTDCFVRIEEQADGYDLQAFIDYSDTSGGGSSATGLASVTGLSDTAALDWYAVYNEYEFTFVIIQGATFRWFSFGSPRRLTKAPADGVARTDAISDTGTVVVGVDRDLTSRLTPSQTVWLINRTPIGVALTSDERDLVKVEAVTPTTVTVSGVSGAFSDGSLLGLDCHPTYVYASSALSSSIRFPTTSALVSISNGTFQTSVNNMTESALDPDVSGLYHGFMPVIQAIDTATYRKTIRGYPETICFFSFDGAVSDADRMLEGYDTLKGWKVFPSITSTFNGQPLCLAIGPGAT